MKFRWKRSFAWVGLRGATEPSHHTGSASLYGTGAEVCPIDDWQRSNLYTDAPPEARYRCDAYYKYGHLTREAIFSCYAKNVDEGKIACEKWLESVFAGPIEDRPPGIRIATTSDSPDDRKARSGRKKR